MLLYLCDDMDKDLAFATRLLNDPIALAMTGDIDGKTE